MNHGLILNDTRVDTFLASFQTEHPEEAGGGSWRAPSGNRLRGQDFQWLLDLCQELG